MVLGNDWLQEKKQAVSTLLKMGLKSRQSLVSYQHSYQVHRRPWLDQAEAIPHHTLTSCSSQNPTHSILGWKTV